MTLQTMNKEVGIIILPEVQLANAQVAARALKDVISKKPKPVIMNGEQYLEYEDWQTVAQFYGYTVKTGDAVAVEIDGVKGAKAHADLVDFHTGLIVGGAEAYCMRDEEKWNTRPKYEWQEQPDGQNKRVKIADEPVPWFQLASMAQTRAGAKAFSNRLRWVVVLAGYRGTPAEEMNEDTASAAVRERRTIDKSVHFCTVHNVNFFKKGRMTGYSHPIDGTSPVQWCNEPEAPPEPPKAAAGAESQVTEKMLANGLDQEWLRGAVQLIGWTGNAGKKELSDLLRLNFGIQVAKDLTVMLSALTTEQVASFKREIERRVENIPPVLR